MKDRKEDPLSTPHLSLTLFPVTTYEHATPLMRTFKSELEAVMGQPVNEC